MYNILYQYLTENKFLYSNQFDFQTGHSIEHVIVQLIDQIRESFEYNKYTPNVFILLKKLELYGATNQNNSWFKNLGKN